jgi:hypothetical protein
MKASDSHRFPQVAAWVERRLLGDGFFWVEDERTLGSQEHAWILRREGEAWCVHVLVTTGAVRSLRLGELLLEADHWVPRLRRGEVGGIILRSTGVDQWDGPERW